MMISKKHTTKRKIETLCLDDVDETKRPRTSPIQQLNETAQTTPTIEQPPKPTPPINIPESLLQRVESQLAQPPILQNQLEIRLKEILPANECIAFVRAENYVGQNGQRSCRIVTETQSKKEVWTTKVLANVNCLKGNKTYIIIGTNIAQSIGELYCYSTMSGTLHSSLRYEHPIMRLTLENHLCGIQLASNQVIVRDLRDDRQVAFYKFTPQFSRIIKDVIEFDLSKQGNPILFMKNSDIWFYSKRQDAWRQIKPSIDILTSLNTYLTFLQKVAPEGFVAKILSNKQLKSTNASNIFITEATEEEQIELLLNALDELEYHDEYILLACVYVNRLISRGRVRRLHIYIESLKLLNETNNFSKVFDEINHLLSTNPRVQKELQDLPNQMIETWDMEEDLGFLDTNDS